MMECRAEGALTTTGVLIAIYVAKLSCWRLEAMQYRCGVYCNGLGGEGGGKNWDYIVFWFPERRGTAI